MKHEMPDELRKKVNKFIVKRFDSWNSESKQSANITIDFMYPLAFEAGVRAAVLALRTTDMWDRSVEGDCSEWLLKHFGLEDK